MIRNSIFALGRNSQILRTRLAEHNSKEGVLLRGPIFVDPEHGDFDLKPGSPALKK